MLALWRGREPILRALGALVAVTAIAYVFTPLTAAGEEGQPISFVWNVRYLAPAVAVGLAILPCLPELRATPRRRAAVLAGLTVLLAFTVASLVQWEQGHTKGAVAAAVLVVAGAALIWALRSRAMLGPAAPRRLRAALAAAALGAAVAAGYAEQDHYLTHRYENTGQVQDLDDALRWSRDVRDARIAVAGIRGVFTQYPFYGTDLSNRVQWLGLRGPHDAYGRIPDCHEWRRAINAGGYTHVVTTFDPYLPGRDAQLAGGALDAVRPRRPDRPAGRPREGVRASRAARPRRLRGPAPAHAGPAPQRAQPQRDAVQERLS